MKLNKQLALQAEASLARDRQLHKQNKQAAAAGAVAGSIGGSDWRSDDMTAAAVALHLRRQVKNNKNMNRI
jgi:hypothetical protein